MRLLLILLLTAALAAQTTPQVGGGNITTAAGNGTAGFSGDGGPGPQAQINFPFGPQEEEFGHLAVDPQGNVYIADKGNHRIRRLAANGVMTTIAGTGVNGFSGDGGPATQAQLSFPCGLAADRFGNLFLTDQGNERVRKIDSRGVITTIAGDGNAAFSGDGGPAIRASLNEPSAVAVDPAGNVYIADYVNDVVRMVNNQTGVITTIAGNRQHGDDLPGQDNVPATTIALGWPSGLLHDGAGNLYIADHHNNCIRVVNLQNGQIRRIAGSARHANGTARGDGGPAVIADLDFPVGLALDAASNLFIADLHDNIVRRVSNPLGVNAGISRVVGAGPRGFLGDAGPASEAFLDFPSGLAIDGGGNLFIADWHNQRVRKVVPGVPPAPGPPPGPPPSQERPGIHSGGLVNGASFAPSPARTAPGSVVSIFGVRLATTTVAASTVPLPTALAGTSVSVTSGSSTSQMPLFFVSPTQINAQLPAEVAHSAEASVVVRSGDLASDPLRIDVSLSETGIFTYGAERAVAVNQNGTLNSPDAPAPRNSYITVYLTGQGALNPPVPTGQAAPSSPLSRSAYDVTATIGNGGALVQFLGATPGFVALSQANILIPHDAPLGDQHLVITVAGHPSNRPVISIGP